MPVSTLYQVLLQQRAALLANERQAASEMVRVYGGIWQRLRAEMDVLLVEYEGLLNAGQDLTGWLYQQSRYERLIRQTQEELRRFAQYAEQAVLDQQSQAIAAALRDAQQQVQAIAGRAGVSISWTQLPADVLEDLVGFSANGSPLRALFDALGASASARIRQELATGVALGFNPERIARAVRESFGGDLARALRVSRTETLRAYREATHRSYQANDDIVDGWVWISACTPRTCAACWARHGTIHPFTERLSDHVCGRCTMAAHLKPVKGMPPQWLPESGVAQFAKLDPAAQRNILGAGAYEAYHAGAIKLEDIAGESFSQDWGSTLRVKSLREMVGKEEARKWRTVGRSEGGFADVLKNLTNSKDVLPVARLIEPLREHWNDALSDRVVLTGERRMHYLNAHPEIAGYEDRLQDLLTAPQEIHRNKRDARIAILYRRVADERWLRLTLWISDVAGLQNSIHSFRLSGIDEVLAGRKAGRLVWRR